MRKQVKIEENDWENRGHDYINEHCTDEEEYLRVCYIIHESLHLASNLDKILNSMDRLP